MFHGTLGGEKLFHWNPFSEVRIKGVDNYIRFLSLSRTEDSNLLNLRTVTKIISWTRYVIREWFTTDNNNMTYQRHKILWREGGTLVGVSHRLPFTKTRKPLLNLHLLRDLIHLNKGFHRIWVNEGKWGRVNIYTVNNSWMRYSQGSLSFYLFYTGTCFPRVRSSPEKLG